MFHTSVIELSRKAFQTNLDFLRERLGKTTLCSVVKGNAYGHGIDNIVPVAQEMGVRQFATFSAGEALHVLENRVDPCEIMIMGYIDDAEIPWAVENCISFYVFDLGRLECALNAAKQVGKRARVHLEVETGMNRTGLEEKELMRAIEMIQENGDALKVEGICTHLAGAESTANYWRIQRQIKLFRKTIGKLRRMKFNDFKVHVASSAAAFTYPDTRYDMARIGIAQYGYWPSHETRMHYYLKHGIENLPGTPDPLDRVIRWKSRVMHVTEVGPGEYVSYGTSYMTGRRERIASVPIGYWHGFARWLSNLGVVLIHGKRAPVAGPVNMNMVLVDVTDLGDVKPGDEVVIIGKQGDSEISVQSFSDLQQRINYEVLVRLAPEIPRFWVE